MKWFKIILLFISLLSTVVVHGQDSVVIKELASDYNNASNDSIRLRVILLVLNSTGLDDIDTAIYLAERGMELALSQKDSNALKSVNMSLSKFAVARNKYSDALRYDLEALRITEAIKDTLSQAVILNSVGEDYSLLDLYEEAFDYYNQSLELAKEKGYLLQEAIAEFNIGKLYLTTGELSKAQEYLDHSMKISQSIGDTLGLAYVKNELALILTEEEKYDSALQDLQKAYDISSRFNEDILTPEIVLNMSRVFVKKSLFDVALIHYDQALEIYEKQNSQGGIATVLFGKGQLMTEQEKHSEAKSLYFRSLELAREVKDSELMIKIYAALASIYEKENNLSLALDYHKKYKRLEDSIFRKKKSDQFEQLQLSLESAKKDAEIQELNQKEKEQLNEIEQQETIRNVLVVILAFTGVLLVSLIKNNNKRKKINDVLVLQQKEIEAKSKELSSLLEVKDKFFSIVSHDLRSPINSLIGILEILDKDGLTQKELQDMGHALKMRLTSTKKLLDTLLDWAMLQMNEIKIKEEQIKLSEVIEANFSFFKDIDEKSVQFESTVDSKVQVLADKNMLDLIIRNIISNSLKFTEEGGVVKVSVKDDGDDSLVVMIADDGVGISQEQQERLFDTSELYTTRGTANEKGTGLGLKLCKEFVERMNGKIWVESEEGKGSIFKFTIRKV